MLQPLMPLADDVVSATVTGLCQGLVLALIVAAVLRCLRTTNAATRHAVAFLALLTLVALPCLHVLGQNQGLRQLVHHRLAPILTEAWDSSLQTTSVTPSWPPHQVSRNLPPTVSPQVPEFLAPLPPAESMRPEGSVLPHIGTASYQPLHTLESLENTGSTAWLEAPAESVPIGTTAFAPSLWRWTAPQGLAVALLACWWGIAIFRLLRLAAQCHSLRKLRDQGTRPSAPMQAEFDRLRRAMDIRRSTELRVISDLPSPILVGWFRPTVLMPEVLAQGKPSDWEPMLIHELAHVGRWDDWTNLIQQGLVALFFFHPAVHWLSRRLAVEREIACDDHVLSAKGSPHSYALFLTEHARRMRGPDWVAAPAAWSNPSQLKERIHMLLNTQRNASPRLERTRTGAWTTTVLLVAALGLYAAPRLTLAGTSQDSPEAPPHPPTAPTAPTEIVVDLTTTVQTETFDPHQERHPILIGDAITTGAYAIPKMTDEATDGGKIKIKAPVSTTIRIAEPTPAPHAPPEPPQPRSLSSVLADSEDRVSLEHRLNHLERMVEQLLESRNTGEGAYKPKDRSRNLAIEIERELAPLRDLQMLENRNLEVLIEKSHKQAQQLAAEAAHQARMEERQARHQAETIARTEVARITSPQRIASLQRRPLEEQRRHLQRQMSQLESQLERLEAELERLDEPTEKLDQKSEARSEGASIKMKAPKPDLEPKSAGLCAAARISGKSNSLKTG